jgi:hypothetical protein
MTSQTVTLLSGLMHAVKDLISTPVHRLRSAASQAPGLSLVLLAVLVFCAVRTIRGDRVSALALIPLSFAWLLFNGPMEGPVLIVISWSHGVTVGDLLSVVCLGLSAWRLVPPLLRAFA